MKQRRRRAGELETAVLTVLWSAHVASPDAADDVWMIPQEVQTELARGGDDLAYNSVMTTLTRLHAKGLLERRGRGRAWEYRPTPGAVEQAASQMQSLLGAGPARAMVLSRFVQGLGKDDEAVLQELLNRSAEPSADDGTDDESV
jgi:predicted transcriptional regulator